MFKIMSASGKIAGVIAFSGFIFAMTTVKIPQKALAMNVCRIADPNDVSLNVRDRPNGKLINSLRNGREVYIHKIGYDKKGRSWARVGGYYKGRYRNWGWVFRRYIDCYSSTTSITEADKFRFQIRNCKRTKGEVICGLIITNTTDRNQEISFSVEDGRAIDVSGNVYDISTIRLGRKSDYAVSTTLTPRIPTKVNYYFAIPWGINRLEAIEFEYYNNGNRKLAIRNIQIE